MSVKIPEYIQEESSDICGKLSIIFAENYNRLIKERNDRESLLILIESIVKFCGISFSLLSTPFKREEFNKRILIPTLNQIDKTVTAIQEEAASIIDKFKDKS